MPHHWGIGVPKFDTVKVVAVPEENTRLAMLKSGEADVISLSRRYVQEYAKNGYVIATKPAASEMQILINNQWDTKSPLHDKRVREAMAYAIDSKAILNSLLLGNGVLSRCWIADVAYTAMPKDLCAETPYDPKKAKQLLAQAGYPNGFNLTYWSYPKAGIPEKLEVDQAIASYLRAVGITATIHPGEYGAYRAQWPTPASHPNTIANNPTVSQVVIGSLIQLFWGHDGFLSTTRGVNPKADAAIDNMLRAPTLDEYKSRLGTAWKDLLDDYNVIMLFSVDEKYAANPKKVAKPWPMGTSTADPNLRALASQ
jgi:ABC-type transport system substrate-binding protein